jgi:ABC-type antimicrobial peptide transport system permease subunit
MAAQWPAWRRRQWRNISENVVAMASKYRLSSMALNAAMSEWLNNVII